MEFASHTSTTHTNIHTQLKIFTVTKTLKSNKSIKDIQREGHWTQLEHEKFIKAILVHGIISWKRV
jgi:hypothetical protein